MHLGQNHYELFTHNMLVDIYAQCYLININISLYMYTTYLVVCL